MTRRLTAGAMLGAIGLAGCCVGGGGGDGGGTAAAGTSAPAEICAGLSELEATFAAVPAISASTTSEQLQQLRSDIERSSQKVTTQRGYFNETARTDLAGARREFLQALDHSGAGASSRINDTYQSVRTTTAAARYSMTCNTGAR